MKRTATIFLAALIGGSVALTLDHFMVRKESGHEVSGQTQKSLITNPQSLIPARFAGFPGMLPESSPDFVKASEIALPTVVHVRTEYAPQKNQFYYYDPFQGFGWNVPQQQQQPQMGSGSGVIISGDGYIVTNNHVVKDASKIEVILFDKRAFPAKVIGRDPSTDIALLKIDEKNLPYLLYGNSDDVKVGQWVLAVGNPFNLTSTVTAGIVSAKARNINIIGSNMDDNMLPPVESFIQTDAAVNPGNSGGALINTSGQLIGINSAIASNTGSYAGYSFAVPVNLARKVVNDLIEYGKVQRAFLGVNIRDIDAKLIEEKKLGKETKGAYIVGVNHGSGADDAGIKAGDIVVQVGDAEVSGVPELQEQISRFRPGDKVVIKVKRNGEEKSMSVELKGIEGSNVVSNTESKDNVSLLGATFENVSAYEIKKLGLDGGVKITAIGHGKLRNAGIREGFIITSIDKKSIYSLDDLTLALNNKEGGILIEGVYPNGMKAYYAFGL